MKKRKQYKCPECGCRDGIVGHFRSGKAVKKEFIYCDSCKWDYLDGKISHKMGENDG